MRTIINNKYSFEEWIKNNPTWNYFILEAKLDYDKLDDQLNIRFNAFSLAYNEWLNYYFK